MRRFCVVLILLLLGWVSSAGAETERILDFAATVQVNTDGSLTVTENITVLALGQEIKRGLVREFPTVYRDKSGRKVTVGFKLLGVERDGHDEPYHTKSMSNGIAIYAGDKDVFLNSGRYTYTFVYRTTRQLGFFEDHDELYWNVTGNGWRLPIDHVSCEVLLPEGAEAGTGWVYEGPQGSSDSFTVPGGAGTVRFQSSRSYGPGEGMTIAVGWPKGFVDPPSAASRAVTGIMSLGPLVPAGAGIVALLLYYMLAWLKVGRDPARGPIVPLFGPPKGFSPAMVRKLWKMRFDKTAFTVGIISMAVQRALKIEEIDTRGTLQLTLSERMPESLSTGERGAWNELRRGSKTVLLKQSSHQKMGRAREAFRTFLKKEVASQYFLSNSKWMVPGVVLTLLTVAGMALFADEPPVVLFISVWLTIWTFGCVVLVRQAANAWKVRGIMGKFGALFATLFAVPFLGGEIGGLIFLISQIGFPAGLIFLAMILTNALFYELLKAPTVIGRKVMDEIEGFRMYLSVAEEDRLNFIHPPEETPELFEKFLPYAIALGVENEWGKRFERVLAATNYQPAWYSGHHWNHLHPAAFAGALGSSMQSAVSSSSTAPGSSSGVGGGGSSGGGGGGGGGGGW